MSNLNQTMSEAHDDLGSFSRPTAIERAKIYAKLQPPRVYHHEPKPDTHQRKKTNLEAIRALEKLGIMLIENDYEVQATVNSCKFTFWPSSNCYFSHASNQGRGRFGVGIPELIEKLCLRLRELSSKSHS